jgi:high affinity Mn2+ porin
MKASSAKPAGHAAGGISGAKAAPAEKQDQTAQIEALKKMVEQLNARIEQMEKKQAGIPAETLQAPKSLDNQDSRVTHEHAHSHPDQKGLALNLPAQNPPESGSNIPQNDTGHARHPVHSAEGLSVSGGVTSIYQGSLKNSKQFGGNKAESTLSADLFIEGPVSKNGAFLLRFDAQRGNGLLNFPRTFTNPSSNPNGPNNDVETWANQESLNLNEARIEQRWFNDKVKLTLGKMDLTSFFDKNAYANKETFQYIAQLFNNNPTIDWGGTVNFFGGGAVLEADLTDDLSTSLLWFEGDGNYQNFFNRPFVGMQAHLKTHLLQGKRGNLRLYGWTRRTPHCRSAANPELFLNCELIDTADRVFIKNGNAGVGLSFDQEISDSLGVWARVGYQNPKVSQFDKAFQLGATVSGKSIGRSEDALGVAYGLTLPSNSYKAGTGFSRPEHYGELYYKYVVSGDGVTTGFHITPDIQFVVNPGGNRNIKPTFAYGVRVQAHF